MSFLNTLIGLAAHHGQQQTPGHAVQQSHPQVQQPLPVVQAHAPQYEDGSGAGIPINYQSMLQHFAQPQAWEDGSGVNMGHVSPQQLNLGISDGNNLQQFMGSNQSYGMQGGGYNPGFTPVQSSPRGNPQLLGHQNPQVRDNGYYWYQ